MTKIKADLSILHNHLQEKYENVIVKIKAVEMFYT